MSPEYGVQVKSARWPQDSTWKASDARSLKSQNAIPAGIQSNGTSVVLSLLSDLQRPLVKVELFPGRLPAVLQEAEEASHFEEMAFGNPVVFTIVFSNGRVRTVCDEQKPGKLHL